MVCKREILIVLVLIIFMTKVNAEEISLSNLPLEKKVGQMIIVKSNDGFNEHFVSLGIGGVFLDGGKKPSEFREIVNKYQNKSKIRLLVATDMEGYWNPFSDYKSKVFGEIKNKEEARALGKEHAKKLKEASFNIDFSPVVESKNKVWIGRSFNGSF